MVHVLRQTTSQAKNSKCCLSNDYHHSRLLLPHLLAERLEEITFQNVGYFQ